MTDDEVLNCNVFTKKAGKLNIQYSYQSPGQYNSVGVFIENLQLTKPRGRKAFQLSPEWRS